MERRLNMPTSAQATRPELPVPGWIVAVLLAFVLPLSLVAAGTSVLPGDVAITRFIQAELPAFFEPLVVAGNVLGTAPVMIAGTVAIAAMLLYRGHQQLSFLVASATVAQLANALLKLTLESPRPTSGLVQVSEDASGFGFPSGHTMGTTVVALVVLYAVTRLWPASPKRHLLTAAILFVPLMTGIARIETGAHWPSDVLGAWIWGALAAIAIVTYAPRTLDLSPSLAARLRPARSMDRTIAASDARRTTT